MIADDKKSETQIRLVEDMLITDILCATDKEILAEAIEDGVDAHSTATRLRSLLQTAQESVGKARLKAAKAAIDSQSSFAATSVRKLRIDEKRAILRQFSERGSAQVKNLTLAARNEETLSEHDLDAFLEALLHLGIIDDEGKAR